jgi:putative Mn2+ efflux pump MntP
MGKWVLLLLAAMIGLAIVGFVVDAARVVVGVVLVVLVVVLAGQWLLRRKS